MWSATRTKWWCGLPMVARRTPAWSAPTRRPNWRCSRSNCRTCRPFAWAEATRWKSATWCWQSANAYGLSQSVTSGIVSATGRGIGLTAFENFIQTDAAINLGNSGGALVNTRGELIGINTARFATLNRDPPEGIGFAIPVNLVRGVTDELTAHGRVIRGWLGVDAWDLSSTNAAALGISGPAVELAQVAGPAAAAGLTAGDIITHIDDERMFGADQAMNRVAGFRPGDTIHILGHRPGAGAFETVAVLEERPAADR